MKQLNAIKSDNRIRPDGKTENQLITFINKENNVNKQKGNTEIYKSNSRWKINSRHKSSRPEPAKC